MSIGMGMGMSGQQRQEMRISPSLIQYSHILQLSGAELRDLILQELDKNPALALEERALCPACGDPLTMGGRCLRCGRGEGLAEAAARAQREADEEEPLEALLAIADQPSLQEHLLQELAAVLPASDLAIAEFLVGELDERGFLDVPLGLVASSLGIAESRVEAVLGALQHAGPLGVGARSVEECLSLQLERLEEVLGPQPLLRRLIAEHLSDLAAGRYAQLARQLQVTPDAILEARELIRAHLRPYPITETADLASWERARPAASAMPDVLIRGLPSGGYRIEVLESRRFQLSVNPLFQDLAVGSRPRQEGGLSAGEQQRLQEQVRAAENFLGFIQDRRSTLERVTAYVIGRQSAFLREGPRQLQPLTRAEVAQALDLHESTISRATKDKYVMLPNRRVVPFSAFFQAALPVHEALRQLVDDEARPYTDTELAELLAAAGHPISRRTVTKYRLQLGILPSNLR